METYDFKNEIIDKNGNKINILDVYNFNKIKFYEDNSVFKVSVVVSCNKTIFSKLSVCYKKK